MRQLFILIILCLVSMGFITPEPPKIEDKPTYEYMRTVRNHLNRLDVVSTNPNGSRIGDYGDMVLFKSGANFYIEVCVSSPNGTSWKGIQITVSP